MLKRQYYLDVKHAQMIQEMAKFHAKDRGTGMDSNLTLARIIEIMYRAWKDKQVILHDNVTPERASRALIVSERSSDEKH